MPRLLPPALVLVAACSTSLPTSPPGSADAAASDSVDAAVAIVVCDATGCGGTVGNVRVAGFTEAEAAQILAALVALPALLTASDVLIERDHTPQPGCADPTTTAVSRPCGLAIMDPREPTGHRVGMLDQLIVERPGRIDHVVANTLAQIWFELHEDAAVAAQLEGWNDCHPCPTADGERCSALEWGKQMGATGGPLLGYYADFAQTTVAALSLGGHDFWFGDVAWFDSSDQACEPAPRLAWVDAHLTGGAPISLLAISLDAYATCGPSSTATGIEVHNVAALDIEIGVVGYDAPSYDVVVERHPIQSGFVRTANIEETGDYPVRVVVYSPEAITATIRSCGCAGGAVQVEPGAPLPICQP